MNQLTDIQMDCIGTLSVHPELFNNCILEPTYFANELGSIFSAMKDYYAKNGLIISTELTKYRSFDLELYLRCGESGYSGDLERFNHIQELVINDFKERSITVLSEKLRRNEIDLTNYDKAYREIIDLHLVETSKITIQDLLQACNDDKKNIFFQRFRRLGTLMKLKENDFAIIAGATGGGKSALALNLVDDLSVNYKCLYYNLEMVPQELLQRLIAIESCMTQDNVSKYNSLVTNDINKANAAINRLAQRDIHIISQSQTLDTIRTGIASNATDKHIIVIIDHIGLLGTHSRNSYERMTEIAKELRKYSLDYNCTIIGLCQLNREATKTSDSPKLSMLRDSGEIEQSASKVLFVWHDEKGYSLVLEKNRSGSLGIVDINYNKASQRMEEFI